jgi:hypothetical protein
MLVPGDLQLLQDDWYVTTKRWVGRLCVSGGIVLGSHAKVIVEGF